MIPRRLLTLALLPLAAAGCTTLPTPKQHWYEFPKDAYFDEGVMPHSSLGVVRARTDFPSLDPENDDFEKLCHNYFNKSVADLIKAAKARGADAVIEVRSVVFLENGKKEAYKTPECADDGEEGQNLAEGTAVKWVSPDSLSKPSAASKASSQLDLAEKSYEHTEGAGRLLLLESMARNAFKAGETAKARDYAQKLLDEAPQYKKEWPYGLAIHHGNTILGRLALKEGDVVKAKTYLLLAGKTPGSPQLNSFGPNMSLANELLQRGERLVVLDYLDLCGNFWRDDFAREQLTQWKAAIRAGKKPDFWAHLSD